VQQTPSDVDSQKGDRKQSLSDDGRTLWRGVPPQPAREAAWLARRTRPLRGRAAPLYGALSDAGTLSMSRKAWNWALGRAHHSQAKKAVGGWVSGVATRTLPPSQRR